MPRILTSLSVIALLAMGQTALAQDTTETKPEDQSTMADGLSTGEEVVPGVPETYIREEHGDWKLQCFKVEGTGAADEACQLYQLLKDEQGTDVAEVSLFRLPSGGKAVAGATVTVPLETLLTAQLTITVDGGKAKRYPFSFCSPVGCYARIGLTAQDIASFKAGAKALVTLVPAPAPDQKVELPMSLKGFTAGFNAASVIKN